MLRSYIYYIYIVKCKYWMRFHSIVNVSLPNHLILLAMFYTFFCILSFLLVKNCYASKVLHYQLMQFIIFKGEWWSDTKGFKLREFRDRKIEYEFIWWFHSNIFPDHEPPPQQLKKKLISSPHVGLCYPINTIPVGFL